MKLQNTPKITDRSRSKSLTVYEGRGMAVSVASATTDTGLRSIQRVLQKSSDLSQSGLVKMHSIETVTDNMSEEGKQNPNIAGLVLHNPDNHDDLETENVY